MHTATSTPLALLLMAMSFSAAIASSSDLAEILGGDCDGDDPRTEAFCECLYDQVRDRLSSREIRELAEFQRREQSSEAPASPPNAREMERLMAITSKLQSIDATECVHAQPR